MSEPRGLAYRPIHPLLFAAAAPLPLYATNWQSVRTNDFVLALAGAVALAVALWAFALWGLAWAWRRSPRSAAFAASAGVLLFFAFQPVFDLWPKDAGERPWAPGLLFALWGGAWVAAMAIAARIRDARGTWTLAANLAGLAAVVVPCATLALSLNDARPLAEAPEASAARVAGERPRPDIYYVVLDGYGRSDRLREYFGFDNAPFVAALRERGFVVDDRAIANYAHTYLSLASSLNFEYVQALGADGAAGPDQLGRWIREARVPHLLRQIGYRVVSFPSSFAATTWTDSEVHLGTGWTSSEFVDALLLRTPLPDFVDFATGTSLYDWHRARVDNILEQLGTLGARFATTDAPIFAFAHVLAPHPPFVFAADGHAPDPPRPIVYWDGDDYYAEGGTRDEYLQGYPAQVAYLNARLLPAIDAILESADPERPPPVIVLHGDHGSGMGLSHRDIARTDARERFPILLAVHAPQIDAERIGEGGSPVNLFRTLLGGLFGAQLPRLPDRAWTRCGARPRCSST